ncbi:MAG: gamma-glutamyl-gamma-aminobutyrate hydrolase family protein [Candidatus Cloacimonetes bacterium]|nr:gamma-glutamyl-gamma-aminobutyrate hydrolase family protein [Candidatus Cloacimonadota bacterium]
MNKPVIGLSMNYMQLGQYHQFHIRDKYIDAVYEHGGLPLPMPCLTDKDALQMYVEMIDGLIIIGGNDYPPQMYNEPVHPKADIMHERRSTSDPILVELILQTNKPVLGICAGMQLLNICTGGKLIQHLDEYDTHFGEKYHEITITESRWLSQIVSGRTITVNSNHHQGIDPNHVGKGFKVVATTADGIIEAMELEGEQMVLAIQWHPERMTDLEHRKRLIEFFISQV